MVHILLYMEPQGFFADPLEKEITANNIWDSAKI